MHKHISKLWLSGAALALLAISGPAVLALPPQANAHAQAANNPATNNRPASPAQPATGQAGTGQANGQSHLAAAQLQACQNRENAINNITSRIDTRAQNQLTLFGTIASRVESFYTSSGKTVANYSQLTSAIDSAKTQAQTDLSTMKDSSTINCTGNDPKAMVTAFQTYLKTEITDLQNYRTTVKNLIVAVAQANGVTVSAQAGSQGGQQ